MAYDTTTKLIINSKRMGQDYLVQRFTEYKVDIDLETDADQFQMVLGNPDGCYTGAFNKFDTVDLKINNGNALSGIIDEVQYNWDDGSSTIQVTGRDIAGVLVDNDAIPCTKYNIKPSEYIKNRCSEFGIRKVVVDPTAPIVKKLIIGAEESEIAVMNGLLVDEHRRIWTIYDTLYMGEWDTNASPSYLFTRGVPAGESGIPIKRFRLRDSGLNMYSEVRIYGSMNDGKEKVVGTAKNDYLIKQGIMKRKVFRSSNNDSSTKQSSSALKKIRDNFRNDIELEITIATSKGLILPNRTAHVIDRITMVNSVFFIKGVTFTKGLDGGSETTITMIPGDVTADIIWNNQGDKSKGSVSGMAGMSLADLIKSRK